MWATLTLMSALSLAPAQTGDFQLTEDRTTYGRLGPTRKDSKFLPGDVYFVTFVGDGLRFDKKGNAKYSMQMELLDPNGKSKFKTTEQDKEVFSIQGGGKVTLDAYASLPADMPAGTYTMKVTVTDRGAEPAKTAELTRKFEVTEKDFGIVRVSCAHDLGGPNGPVFPSPSLGCVGQVLFLHFGLTGFERDAKTKQPALKLEMNLLDADGKPTLAGPVTEGLPKGDDPVPEQLSVVPLFFPLMLTKPGKYTVELTATDLRNMKKKTVTYPLTVVEPPK
jgi:hypothetical protein